VCRQSSIDRFLKLKVLGIQEIPASAARQLKMDGTLVLHRRGFIAYFEIGIKGRNCLALASWCAGSAPKRPRESVPATPAPAAHDLLLTPPGRQSTCYKMLRCPVVSKVQRAMFSAQGNMSSEVTSKSHLALVDCDSRHKRISQKELRRYVPRSILPPKSPFRPHFGAFYPHPGSKSALRCGRGDPLFETPETCHPASTWKIFSLPTLDDARTSGHRHFPGGSCLRLTTELAKMERGPIARSGPLLSVWHQTGRSVRKNPAFSRARHPGYGPWGRARTGAWLRTNWRAPTEIGVSRHAAAWYPEPMKTEAGHT